MREERRHYNRLQAYLPITLQQGQQGVIHTLTKDIGPAGLRCLCQSAFPVHTQLTVELVLPNRMQPLVLQGQTAWLRALPHSDQFEIGIAFLNPDEETQRLLSNYTAVNRPGLTPQIV